MPPQLKYCRSYSRECGKRSAPLGGCGEEGSGGGRGTDGRRSLPGVEAGLILNMMISRIRRRSGLPLPPSYSPPWYVRHTGSLRRVATRTRKHENTNARNTHLYTHTHTYIHACHTCAHTLSTPAFYTPAFRRPPYVTTRRGTCATPEGLMYVPCLYLSSFLFRTLSFVPSLPSPTTTLSFSLCLRCRKGTTRDVTCFSTLFVIFFLCGAFNRLLVRAGVYIHGDRSSDRSYRRERSRYVCRRGSRRLIEREPFKCPEGVRRECVGT